MGQTDVKAEELAAIVREIQDRVRSRYPEGEAPGLGVALPDLLPVLHARDAAEAKVAAIGSVNPRPGGPLNAVIQWAKNTIARGLGWFVRDQIDYNRAILQAIEANLEALNEVNRTFVAVGNRLNAAELLMTELKDIRAHWIPWRDEWERKLVRNEIHYLRALAELEASHDSRMRQSDASQRDAMALQHAEFTRVHREAVDELQSKFWIDFEKVRLEYERLIHTELRVIRQKPQFPAEPLQRHNPEETSYAPSFDYTRFADRFRGTEQYVRERQQFYVPMFQDRTNVLDIGCGRGEFLETMRAAGVHARGIDLDDDSIHLCHSKGLEVEKADLFAYLTSTPDGTLDGIFSSQVVEHLPPERLPHMVQLCAAKLRQGGILVLETPNPECLAIFATHFYLDPTHTRPIPPNLLAFYMEESGLGRIEVHRLSPAMESMPSLAELPQAFRDTFFGALDYGIVGRKL